MSGGTGCEDGASGAGASALGWSQAKVSLLRGGNTAHPFHGIDMSGTGLRALGIAAVGDVDNDGDADLLVSRRDGTLSFFQRSGGRGTEEVRFSEVEGTASPFNYKIGVPGIDVPLPSPHLVDIDGDGKLDLVCAVHVNRLAHCCTPEDFTNEIKASGAASLQSSFRYWKNRGGRPVKFDEQIGKAQNPFDFRNLQVGTWSKDGEKTRGMRPTFMDGDGDGDQVSVRCSRCLRVFLCGGGRWCSCPCGPLHSVASPRADPQLPDLERPTRTCTRPHPSNRSPLSCSARTWCSVASREQSVTINAAATNTLSGLARTTRSARSMWALQAMRHSSTT